MTANQSSCCAGHAELDRSFAELLRAAGSRNWTAAEAAWAEFSNDLIDHMAYEEAELFPDFASEDPRNAALVKELVDEHRDVRRQIERLDAQIRNRSTDLGTLTGTLTALSEQLKGHARRETDGVYEWIAQRQGVRGRHRPPGASVSRPELSFRFVAASRRAP